MLHTVIARDYHRAVTQTIAAPFVNDRRQRRASGAGQHAA